MPLGKSKGYSDAMKLDTEMPRMSDVALGDILAVQTTPSQEKRVVRKLDMM